VVTGIDWSANGNRFMPGVWFSQCNLYSLLVIITDERPFTKRFLMAFDAAVFGRSSSKHILIFPTRELKTGPGKFPSAFEKGGK